MITFFKKIFKRKKSYQAQIFGVNLAILRLLKSMDADIKQNNNIIQTEVSEISKGYKELSTMIYKMVETLSKYFKLEIDFMEKEKERLSVEPTDHDKQF